MINLLNIQRVYLLGIGGIGMSALARFFHQRGAEVKGYDKTPSGLTEQLEAEGMAIHYTDEPEGIPMDWLQDEHTLFIYTPAIPADLKEKQRVEQEAKCLMKRAEVLGALSKDYTCLAVAGTHGKTTTSTLLTHLLETAGLSPSAFLGGISVNYNSNLVVGSSNLLVVEADEFDRSFHKLFPNGAIVTAMDADHLDIYGTAESLAEAFVQFANQVAGPLVYRHDLPLQGVGFGRNQGDYHIANLQIVHGQYTYTLVTPAGEVAVTQPYPGLHNIDNAVAAAALAHQFGVDLSTIAEGISTFAGVQRRFEKHLEKPRVLIDDYAHHPEEIKALVTSVKGLYPNAHITGVFQPHLYSRTRDFMLGFAESLSLLDTCWLLDIYPARELPIPGITSQELLHLITSANKALLTKEQLVEKVKKQQPEVLLTIGAGDIDRLLPQLKSALS